MVTIIFATPEEAHETLKSTEAKKIDRELYAFSQGKILISGMGPAKTEETLLSHIEQIDTIVNIGIAGGLKTAVVTNRLYPIASASMTTCPDIALQEMGVKLITEHTPLWDIEKRDMLSGTYDLVDMEGYVIAKIAKLHKKPCKLYKIVSDYCTPTASEDIRKKLPELSKSLSAYISQIMSGL